MQRDRESLAFRLQKWRESRLTSDAQAARDREAAEIARDLRVKEAAELLRIEQEEKRRQRQSLQFRMQEAKRLRSWEEGRQAIQKVL